MWFSSLCRKCGPAALYFACCCRGRAQRPTTVFAFCSDIRVSPFDGTAQCKTIRDKIVAHEYENFKKCQNAFFSTGVRLRLQLQLQLQKKYVCLSPLRRPSPQKRVTFATRKTGCRSKNSVLLRNPRSSLLKCKLLLLRLCTFYSACFAPALDLMGLYHLSCVRPSLKEGFHVGSAVAGSSTSTAPAQAAEAASPAAGGAKDASSEAEASAEPVPASEGSDAQPEEVFLRTFVWTVCLRRSFSFGSDFESSTFVSWADCIWSTRW